MFSRIFILIFFISSFSFGQLEKEYVFDYKTEYKIPFEKFSTKDIIIGNSNNDNYFFHITIDTTNYISSISFYDAEIFKMCKYEIEKEKHIFEIDDLNQLLKNFTYFNSLSYNPPKYFTEIDTEVINENEYYLIINNYKNKKKKKLKNKAIIHIAKNDIVENQILTTRIRFAYNTELNKLKNIKGVVKDFFIVDLKTNEKNILQKLISIDSIQFSMKQTYNNFDK